MALPPLFAVPRFSLIGGEHHFQILRSSTSGVINENCDSEEFIWVSDRNVDSSLVDVSINNNGRSHTEVYWHLPLFLKGVCIEIPVIDFHLTSWIPYTTRKIPLGLCIEEIDSVIEIITTLRSEKAGELAFRTPPSTPMTQIPSAPIRPPRGSPSDAFEIPASLLEAFDYEDAEQEQPLHSNQSSHVSSIPRHVIDMIIDHKKRSGDSCSISTTPFVECEHLSVTMPCCHVFDRDSLKQWLDTKNECPECRTALSNTIDV